MKLAVVLVHGRSTAELARAWHGALKDVEDAGVTVVRLDAAGRQEEALQALHAARAEFLVVASPDGDDVLEAGRGCAAALGIDGLNVETIPPGAIRLLARPDEDAPRLVRAALAAASDARMLPAAHRRFGSSLGGKRVSRRRLFTGLFSPVPVLVPLVDETRCALQKGCQACATSCPADAIERAPGGAMRIKPDACASCGLCVPACPASAIRFPSLASHAWAARVRAMLHPEPPGTWSLVVGSAAALETASRAEEAALPLVVACAGAVPPSFLLHALRAGARGVLLLPCPPDARCAGRCLPAARRAVEAADAALRLAGRSTGSIAASKPTEAGPELRDLPPPGLPSPAAIPATLGRAAREILVGGEAPIPVAASAGILAALPVVSNACTLCGLCAEACPTGALRLGEDNTAVRLLRSHADCVACGLCVGACPERAITLTRGLHAAHLREDAVAVAFSARGRCRGCGSALLPRALIEAVAARAQMGQAVRKGLEYCDECRLLRREPRLSAPSPADRATSPDAG